MLSTALTLASSISIATFADILSVSEINQTLDIGSAILHSVTHPEKGHLILVNTPEGSCGLLPV